MIRLQVPPSDKISHEFRDVTPHGRGAKLVATLATRCNTNADEIARHSCRVFPESLNRRFGTAVDKYSYYEDVSVMPSSPSTSTPVRQALTVRRKQKYGAARAFYLVIAIVTAFTIWGLLINGDHQPVLSSNRALQKRSSSSASHGTSGGLVRRDEEVEALTGCLSV